MALDLDRLLDGLDLVQLARDAGAKLNGQQSCACPIHHGDNSRGFHIWTAEDGRQMFTCYTHCGSGNALTFLKRVHGVEGMELIRRAADLARIPLGDLGLTDEAVKAHQVRELRRDVLDLAARYYLQQFRKRKCPAIAYAVGRGFKHRALMRFGFSDGGTGLREYLAAAGADLQLAQQLGLVRQADGRDFTANGRGREASPAGWLVYVHRAGGRVDYLSARAITPPADMPDPNDKSRNLPGDKLIYRADVKGDLNVVIVEGQADAESLRQLGLSAWALCGTSLSADDLRDLGRRKQVYLWLDDDSHRDGDEAQQRKRTKAAAERAVALADRAGPLTRVGARLPQEAKDLNEWLQQGATADLVRQALSVTRYWIDQRLELVVGTPLQELDEASRQISGLVVRLPDTTRARYMKKAAKVLGITERELRDMLASERTGRGDYVLSKIEYGRLTFLGKPLCNWAGHIVSEQSIDNGADPTHVRYTIEGRLASGEPLDTLEVPAEEFEGMDWLARWGVRQVTYINRGERYQLARALKEVSMGNGLKRERVYTFTGWTSAGSARGFLSASGRLHAGGLDGETRVDLGSNNLKHYHLPEPPSGEALVKAVRASLAYLDAAPRSITAVLWAAMFAAPLTEIQPLNAVVWPYGPTQSGKSTISHLALAHYGAGFVGTREFHAPVDWTSTVTHLEGAMFRVKDAPVIIDDFAPQFTSEAEARELKKKAALVIRSVGNRSARGRENGDLTSRASRPPRGLVIATSENPLVGQSIVGRMIYVTVSRGDVLKDGGNPALDQAQEAARSGLYAQAMSAYLRWLATNWERVIADLPDIINNAARWARSQFPKDQSRLPDYYAILQTGQSLALQAFREMNLISAEQATREEAANAAAILAVVLGQADKIAAESPAQMFFRAVDQLLTAKLVHLVPKRPGDDWAPPLRSEPVGWYDPERADVVWLNLEPALAAAIGFWKNLNAHLDAPVDAMRRHLDQANVLSKRDKKQVEVSVWLDGKTRRALEISVPRLRELYGLDLRPDLTTDDPDEPPPAPPITQAGLDLL